MSAKFMSCAAACRGFPRLESMVAGVAVGSWRRKSTSSSLVVMLGRRRGWRLRSGHGGSGERTGQACRCSIEASEHMHASALWLAIVAPIGAVACRGGPTTLAATVLGIVLGNVWRGSHIQSVMS